MTLLTDHQLPEPAEKVVFLAALPMASVAAFAAVFIVGIGALAMVGFSAVFEGARHASRAAVSGGVRLTGRLSKH